MGSQSKPALDLIEEATHLLRTAAAGTLALYYVGTAPFVLALLYFWADMSRNPFAEQHLADAAFAVAALFVWMKFCQTLFVRRVRVRLAGEASTPLSAAAAFRMAVAQTTLQPLGLLPIGICLSALVYSPFLGLLIAVAVGGMLPLFYTITAVGDGSANNVSEVFNKARRLWMLWPRQNITLMVILYLFGLCVFLSLTVFFGSLPGLLQTLFGVQSVFTQSVGSLLNSTFFAAMFGLAYLCVDPILKTVYALRCFYGESLKSGEDLKAELRRFRVSAGVVAVVLAAFALGSLFSGRGGEVSRRYATVVAHSYVFRGLKPTATGGTSLRGAWEDGTIRMGLYFGTRISGVELLSAVPPHPGLVTRSLPLARPSRASGFAQMELPLLQNVYPSPETRYRDSKPFAASQAAQVPWGEGTPFVSSWITRWSRTQSSDGTGHNPFRVGKNFFGRFPGVAPRNPPQPRAECQNPFGIQFEPPHPPQLLNDGNAVVGIQRRARSDAPYLSAPGVIWATSDLPQSGETITGGDPGQTRTRTIERVETASPPDLDHAIDQTIHQRKYTWRMPREAAPKDAKQGVIGRFFEKVAEMLRKVIRAVFNWWRDLLRKLFPHRNISRSYNGSGIEWMTLLQILLFVLIAAAVCALVIFIYRLWQGKPRLDAVTSEPLQKSVPDITDENVGADQLPEDGWTRLGRELLERGEFRLALRAFYLASLAYLAQRSLITLARFKSNHDYERELRRRAHSFPDLLSIFGDNLPVFERIWYGRHDVDGELVNQFAANVQRMKGAV